MLESVILLLCICPWLASAQNSTAACTPGTDSCACAEGGTCVAREWAVAPSTRAQRDLTDCPIFPLILFFFRFSFGLAALSCLRGVGLCGCKFGDPGCPCEANQCDDGQACANNVCPVASGPDLVVPIAAAIAGFVVLIVIIIIVVYVVRSRKDTARAQKSLSDATFYSTPGGGSGSGPGTAQDIGAPMLVSGSSFYAANSVRSAGSFDSSTSQPPPPAFAPYAPDETIGFGAQRPLLPPPVQATEVFTAFRASEKPLDYSETAAFVICVADLTM